jgi:molybdate transport system permease protein
MASGRVHPRRGGLPFALLVPAAVAIAFLVIPMVAVLVNVPWDQFWHELRSHELLVTLELSLRCATISMLLSIVFGVPLAWVLARLRIPGRSLLRALVTVPLVLPPVVGGVALLYAFGRNGLVGRWIDEQFGFTLPFTTNGVIVAETFVAMPFLIVSVEGAIRGLDVRYEDAAASLGASRWFAFRHVTLPSLGPAIAAGSVLCWARALGEFGATITFAGNFPGTTQTMPLAVYIALQNSPGAALVLSVILLALSIVLLAALRERWMPGGSRQAPAPV